MDLKTACVLVLAIVVILAEAKNLDPNTSDETLSQVRRNRQLGYGGFPGSNGIASSQATAFSSGSGFGGFPGYGGGGAFSAANAFAGSNSYGKK